MRFSIGTKLFCGFLAVILLTGLIAFLAVTRLSELHSIVEEFTQRELSEVHTLGNIRSVLSEMEPALRHSFLDAREGKRLHGRWEREMAELLSAYRSFDPVMPREEEGLLGKLTVRYGSLQAMTAAVAGLVQQGEDAQAKNLLLGSWREAHRETMESLDRLLDYETNKVQRTADLARSRSGASYRTIIALSVTGVLLSLALALGITFSLTGRLGGLVLVTGRVARGDLTTKAEVKGGDEIGLLALRFNEMMDRLKISFENQRRFYADASHELRTPLAVIRGEAEVALRGPEKPPEEYRETLKTVIDVTSQMGRLVDELLFLARTEGGNTRFEMAEVALLPLLEEVARQTEGLAALKGVSVELEARTPVAVAGDAQRLRQAVLILMDNAIKYTGPGGRVRLALGREADRARVTVSDTGAGIAEEDLPRVFERFYRADRERTGSDGGTGLGLSIARSIVKAHQGEIFVDSKLGEGSAFSILVPCLPS